MTAGACRRPNVVFVIAEHHNGQALGSEPGSVVRTPVLDRLAAEGLSFCQMRTPTAICAPARASVNSALYAHANGMWNNNHTPAAIRRDIFPGVRLWSENLKDAGYRMLFLGRWHVSHERSPAAFGWEEVELAMGGERGHGALRNTRYRERDGWTPRLLYGETTAPPEGYGDTHLTTRAVETIEAQTNGEQPWCMYVGYQHVHAPYVAHERFLSQYDVASIPKPPGWDDDLRDKPNLYRRLHEQNWGGLEWHEVAQMIRHRYAMISYLDEQVGRLVEALERTGQMENTLFIYTADHGDFSGSHGLFQLGVPAFDYVYRVPLVMRWPAGIRQPGRRPDPFVSLLDIGPTILDAAGAAPLENVHGESLLPFLRGDEPAEWREDFYGEFLGHESLYTQRQVRTKRHKYVWNSFDYDELYDLELDPGETVNRRDDPAYTSIKRDLIARLWRNALETGDVIMSGYNMNGNLPFGPGIVPGVVGQSWNARLRGA